MNKSTWAMSKPYNSPILWNASARFFQFHTITEVKQRGKYRKQVYWEEVDWSWKGKSASSLPTAKFIALYVSWRITTSIVTCTERSCPLVISTAYAFTQNQNDVIQREYVDVFGVSQLIYQSASPSALRFLFFLEPVTENEGLKQPKMTYSGLSG